MLPGLTVALAPAGAWGASSMRWPPASPSSQALLSRRSCTSSSGSWVSFFLYSPPSRQGALKLCPPRSAKARAGWGPASFDYPFLSSSMLHPCSALHFLPGPMFSGTPTEESWPGVMSISEFRAYNFPRYLPQPLLSHAPR